MGPEPRFLALALVLASALAPRPALAQRLGDVSAAVQGNGGGGGYVPVYAPAASTTSGRAHRAEGTILASPYSPIDRAHAPVVGIVEAQGAYLVDHVARGTVAGRVRIVGILDFEARYDFLAERTLDGVGALGFGRLGLTANYATVPCFEARGGVAALVYHDGSGVTGGGLASLELDVLPIAPLVIRGDVGLGTIGAAFAAESRITLGLQVDRTELALGYSVFHVESLADPRVAATLHGPMLGVRVSIY